MRALFLVLWLLLGSACAFAQAPNHWLTVKTDHFTVVTDGNDRQARHIAGQLERMHAIFAKLLPSAHDDAAAPILVLALRDRKEFQAVEPAAYLQKGSLTLAGLFLSGEDRNYILLRLDTDADHPYETVYHEYTHYMTREATYLPLWLNEGFAQFYQNTEIQDREVYLGMVNTNELLFLRQQRLIPLATLFAVDHDSPYYHEEDKGSVFYGESWALTHFLTVEDFGKPQSRLTDYLHNLARGQTPVIAAEHAFGNLNALQSQLSTYIERGDYKSFRMNLATTVDEKALEVQPASTPFADAVRADILARNGRTAEAETLARSVLAAEPGSPVSHETMAWIKLREGDTAAAQKWYSEAVSLHSTSYLAYYNFAALTMQKGDLPVASANLEKAVELNPHFAPALDLLARSYAMQHTKLDEAIQMELRAVGLDLGNINYRLNAAELRVARGDFPSAIAVLKTTEKVAHTTADRERVAARLEQIETYKKQLDDFEAAKLAASGPAGSAKSPAGSATAEASTPAGPAQPSSWTRTVTDTHGKTLRPITLHDPDHKLPEGPPSGPKHTVTGSVRKVGCFYPKGMTLEIVGSTRSTLLYSNDMYAVSYTSGNFTPSGDLDPCRDFEGLKATVTYGEVSDPTVAGQIVSMELNH